MPFKNGWSRSAIDLDLRRRKRLVRLGNPAIRAFGNLTSVFANGALGAMRMAWRYQQPARPDHAPTAGGAANRTPQTCGGVVFIPDLTCSRRCAVAQARGRSGFASASRGVPRKALGSVVDRPGTRIALCPTVTRDAPDVGEPARRGVSIGGELRCGVVPRLDGKPAGRMNCDKAAGETNVTPRSLYAVHGLSEHMRTYVHLVFRLN